MVSNPVSTITEKVAEPVWDSIFGTKKEDPGLVERIESFLTQLGEASGANIGRDTLKALGNFALSMFSFATSCGRKLQSSVKEGVQGTVRSAASMLNPNKPVQKKGGFGVEPGALLECDDSRQKEAIGFRFQNKEGNNSLPSTSRVCLPQATQSPSAVEDVSHLSQSIAQSTTSYMQATARNQKEVEAAVVR